MFHPRPSARTHRVGFTLVEIMMVVFIIGFLLAIAIPNFIQAREVSRGKTCLANLREIEQAKHQYIMDHNISTFTNITSADPTLGALYPTYLRNFPVCQAGGTYSTGDYVTSPSCSLSTANPSQFGLTGPYPHALP